MSSPCKTPPLFTPCTESGCDPLQYWPEIDKRLEDCPQIETPSSKKLKISETVASARMPQSNIKVLTNTFFKTQACMNFGLGNFMNGDKSRFSRGSGNIQRPMLHEQGLDRKEGYVAGIWNPDHGLKNKMKSCRIFSRGGYCPYGESCCFLHEGLEKSREYQGKSRESSFVSNGCTGSVRSYRNRFGQMEFKKFGASSMNTNQIHANPGFWRTKLCYKWELYGNCPYKEKCVYAELRRHSGQAQEEEHAAPKTLSSAKANGSTCVTGKGAMYVQPLQGKKCCTFKWEKLEKINRIYADWIDDMPLVHSSVSEGLNRSFVHAKDKLQNLITPSFV